MKINQNVTFLRNVTDASALTTAKDNVSTQRSASGAPAVAGQAQPHSPAPVLPSTNGDFDAARVALIRENISAGRYQVNTAKIADGLLATVRDLLSPKSHE